MKASYYPKYHYVNRSGNIARPTPLSAATNMPKHSPRIDTNDNAEYRDLYDPPRFNDNDRNYFFNLNDLELSKLKQFRIVQNKAHFILLLGYFKAKPVTLTFTWVNGKK